MTYEMQALYSQKLSPVIDLGSSPPSNAYLSKSDLNKLEKWFPLKVNVCNECFLVQTEDYSNADELFDGNYAYFSSFLKQCSTIVRIM